MDTEKIVAAIDREIGNLQQARDILAGARKPPQRETRMKRVLSPEARQRIATAQKKRWAKQKAA